VNLQPYTSGVLFLDPWITMKALSERKKERKKKGKKEKKGGIMKQIKKSFCC
jgi:hypothetical protein